jgi:hypothetical protein
VTASACKPFVHASSFAEGMTDAVPNVTMKILAILAAFLVSTVTASAQPKLGVTQPSRATLEPKKTESDGRLVLGDKKPNRPKKQKVLVDGWAEITDATPARFGTVFVRIGSAAGPFAKLRIDAVKGTVKLRQVKVHYGDGTEKVFAVTKSVNASRQRSAFIDLGGAKVVDQIDIVTDRRPAGEYAIYGTAITTSSKQTCC